MYFIELTKFRVKQLYEDFDQQQADEIFLNMENETQKHTIKGATIKIEYNSCLIL